MTTYNAQNNNVPSCDGALVVTQAMLLRLINCRFIIISSSSSSKSVTYWIGGSEQFAETDPLQVVCRIESVEAGCERGVTFVEDSLAQLIDTRRVASENAVAETARPRRAPTPALRQDLTQQQTNFTNTFCQPRSFPHRISMRTRHL